MVEKFLQTNFETVLHLLPPLYSGPIRGGSSGSIEPLNFWEKAKLNHMIFRIWLRIDTFGTNRFLFEPLDSKS